MQELADVNVKLGEQMHVSKLNYFHMLSKFQREATELEGRLTRKSTECERLAV